MKLRVPMWIVLIIPVVLAWAMILLLSYQVGALRHRVLTLESDLQKLK